jgi:hypothetical protein
MSRFRLRRTRRAQQHLRDALPNSIVLRVQRQDLLIVRQGARIVAQPLQYPRAPQVSLDILLALQPKIKALKRFS